MYMMDDKYHPRSFEELAEDPMPVTLLNEPVREVIELRPGQASASLYALLVGLRNQAQALLERLETRGVCAEGCAAGGGQGSLRGDQKSG
jgi:hypothetical protein